jgi:probable phosphoglycerate mutase
MCLHLFTAIPDELSETLRTRLTLIVNHIASQYVGKCIAIITHAGAINAYIAASLGLKRDFFFPASNTSISIMRVRIMRVRGKQHLLVSLNDIAHLSRLDR